ncbi:hypothetical protein Bca52824_086200 [Brassica carinata]|uniref:Uncharacterized protein n=1 Tax=Brassica carinata TaxID=52824 RepID=A0A8X7TLS3_BRACI|nr:hypothetical protein Bca52824_086200 [Brassica carinata]
MQLPDTITLWIRTDANPPSFSTFISLESATFSSTDRPHTCLTLGICCWAQSNKLPCDTKKNHSSTIREAEGDDVVTVSTARTRHHGCGWPMDASGRREKLRSIMQQCFKQQRQGQYLSHTLAKRYSEGQTD